MTTVVSCVNLTLGQQGPRSLISERAVHWTDLSVVTVSHSPPFSPFSEATRLNAAPNHSFRGRGIILWPDWTLFPWIGLGALLSRGDAAVHHPISNVRSCFIFHHVFGCGPVKYGDVLLWILFIFSQTFEMQENVVGFQNKGAFCERNPLPEWTQTLCSLVVDSYEVIFETLWGGVNFGGGKSPPSPPANCTLQDKELLHRVCTWDWIFKLKDWDYMRR